MDCITVEDRGSCSRAWAHSSSATQAAREPPICRRLVGSTEAGSESVFGARRQLRDGSEQGRAQGWRALGSSFGKVFHSP